ncbi:unnamed protein product [Rangifer tarandus platyrhynchus]|uniref:Uncharacterized protein n=1 Tax=Rangifer tarandus platyrhynchus TaxID=3082113 RepID=A0AC59ZIP2_RANTA
MVMPQLVHPSSSLTAAITENVGTVCRAVLYTGKVCPETDKVGPPACPLPAAIISLLSPPSPPGSVQYSHPHGVPCHGTVAAAPWSPPQNRHPQSPLVIWLHCPSPPQPHFYGPTDFQTTKLQTLCVLISLGVPCAQPPWSGV